jgi:hypothetical protein
MVPPSGFAGILGESLSPNVKMPPGPVPLPEVAILVETLKIRCGLTGIAEKE